MNVYAADFLINQASKSWPPGYLHCLSGGEAHGRQIGMTTPILGGSRSTGSSITCTSSGRSCLVDLRSEKSGFPELAAGPVRRL